MSKSTSRQRKTSAGAKTERAPKLGVVEGSASVPFDDNSIEHNDTGETPLYHVGLGDWEERCVCERCGGEGFIEYNDGDGGDWGEDCPSEENHLITCRACHGTGEAQ